MLSAIQTGLIYVGSFIAVLSLVVFVHEFGHFQVARWCKVSIDTFSIGFGKALASWRDRHGVEWKIGALPLGGYVKFTEDADGTSMMPAHEVELTPEERADARRRGIFHAQPIISRALVVAAGPVTNFIFSIFAFALIMMIMGRDVTDNSRLSARIDGVAPQTAAAAAGLREGDIITAVNGAAISSFAQLSQTIAARAGQPTTLSVNRGGETIQLQATPGSRASRAANGEATQVGFLGIERRTQRSERVIERVGPIAAVQFGASQTWEIVRQTGIYVYDVFGGRQSANNIAGPLGILDISGRTATAALSQDQEPPVSRFGDLLLSLVQLAAILSVAVGIVNLLPIPILDGGHLLFYAIEAVRGGRPLPLIAQEWAFRAGIAVMGTLFLFATWNDIQRHLG